MEFTPFEKITQEALEDCKGAVKHCAKNAIHHLEKAWVIANIDVEMAIFRGITAEEEAASCLFYTLKNQKYKNSNKLLFKEHTYKQALFPYIKSVIHNLTEFNEHNSKPFGSPVLRHIEHNNRKAMSLHVKINAMNMVMTPTPPLHFNISDKESGQILTFENSFKKTCQGEQFSTALKYVKHIAGERNRLLYADAGGRPKVSGDIAGYLKAQKVKVFLLLHLMLLIEPWIDEGQSAFVQQGLDGFLLLLERIQESELCLPDNGK